MHIALIPGFSQPPSIWNPTAEALAPRATEALEVPDGLDFAATAGALGEAGGRAVWVGYSLGGRLALQLAHTRPELVAALVLVSCSPGIADAHARARRVAEDEARAVDVETRGVDTFLTDWLAQPLFATLPADTAGHDARVAAMTPSRLAHQLRALGQGVMPPRWVDLPSIAVPATVVVGSLDTRYTDIGTRMAEALPDARLVTVTGGHSLPLEAPQALAAVIAETHDRLH